MPGRAHSGRVAIIGHVEWVTHARGLMPPRGGIADLSDPFDEPAGGGGVAACAAARLGAPVVLMTALGDDATAQASAQVLADRGVRVIAAARPGRQTPALSVSGTDGERSIVVVGPRLQPRGEEALDWDAIDPHGAAYYAGEDPGALVRARRAGTLVVSARRVDDLIRAGVTADVVVGSATDPDEDAGRIPAQLTPRYRVLTDGERGGRIIGADGSVNRYSPSPARRGVVDTYGCGDTFAAGLAVGLARGQGITEAAALGAAAAADCAGWRGGIGPAP